MITDPDVPVRDIPELTRWIIGNARSLEKSAARLARISAILICRNP